MKSNVTQSAGICTITRANGNFVHITELSPRELCDEWVKLKHENQALYDANKAARRGWCGVLLRLMGVQLAEPMGKRLLLGMSVERR
jgi:hypothetical protein